MKWLKYLNYVCSCVQKYGILNAINNICLVDMRLKLDLIYGQVRDYGKYKKWKREIPKGGKSDLNFYESTIRWIDMIDKNMMQPEQDCFYESLYNEYYAKYDKIRIHYLYATGIGDTSRSLSVAWFNGLKEKDKISEMLLNGERVKNIDVLMPYWEQGFEKSIVGYSNTVLQRCIADAYEVINYSNSGLWKYIFTKHNNKIEIVNRLPKSLLAGKGHDFITLRPEDRRKICSFKKEIGLRESQDFVIIFARDTAYYQKNQIKYDDSYENFRNSDIEAFDDAVEYLHDSDIFSIRVGKTVHHRYNNPLCIDYASDYRDEMLDLYLIKECKFAVGTSSGLINLAQSINKPCVICNEVAVASYCGHAYSKKDLYIPKMILDKSGRTLTFNEMWDLEAMSRYYNKNRRYGDSFYTKRGLRFIDNSSQEIKEVTEEMNKRLNGTWIETDEEKQLLQRYHKIRRLWLKKHSGSISGFREINCGVNFLKKHKDMLQWR